MKNIKSIADSILKTSSLNVYDLFFKMKREMLDKYLDMIEKGLKSIGVIIKKKKRDYDLFERNIFHVTYKGRKLSIGLNTTGAKLRVADGFVDYTTSYREILPQSTRIDILEKKLDKWIATNEG